MDVQVQVKVQLGPFEEYSNIHVPKVQLLIPSLVKLSCGTRQGREVSHQRAGLHGQNGGDSDPFTLLTCARLMKAASVIRSGNP